MEDREFSVAAPLLQNAFSDSTKKSSDISESNQMLVWRHLLRCVLVMILDHSLLASPSGNQCHAACLCRQVTVRRSSPSMRVCLLWLLNYDHAALLSMAGLLTVLPWICWLSGLLKVLAQMLKHIGCLYWFFLDIKTKLIKTILICFQYCSIKFSCAIPEQCAALWSTISSHRTVIFFNHGQNV